jgi:alcohol dehydrogenase class IV
MPGTTDFSLFVPTHVRFGPGCRQEVPDLLAARGWTRVGLVIDHNLRDVPRVRTWMDDLQRQLAHVAVGWSGLGEPTYDGIEAMRDGFRGQDLHAMLAVGGGSALDTGKAMAALVHNAGPAISYRGFDKLTRRVLPIVAVPTTAGTGSEVTPNASFVDTGERRKMGINGEAIRPALAVLDPELTLSCPREPTVSAAADSLVHATEAYVAKKTNVLARLFAREGFGRVFRHLPAVLASPGDVAARAEVMYGAFLAGVALMHSGTGPAAAMSYPLGVRHGVPHGVGGAVFLAHVAQHNVRAGVHDYADLYGSMDGADCSLPRDLQAQAFVDRLSTLLADSGVPGEVRTAGVGGAAVERFVRDTLELRGALDQNPAPFGDAEVRWTLARLGAGA